MKSPLLQHLSTLVQFDTQNPPRSIPASHRIFGYLESALSGFRCQLIDHSDGRVNFYARRGTPRVLYNVHLDTVPCGGGWTTDPLELTIKADRAYGRGVCDIKGAAACLLTLAQNSDADLAFLFSTDEEGANSCCINQFLQTNQNDLPQFVVVAEPTKCEAVTGHRGYLSVTGQFKGLASHTSMPKRHRNSAVHSAIHWAEIALNRVEALEIAESDNLTSPPIDYCFNIGTIAGGSKNNVVADQATISWSARLPSGHSNEQLLEALTGPADQNIFDNEPPNWNVTFTGPPLPTENKMRETAQTFVQQNQLPVGGDVDFWTEGSLFSQARIPTIVLGPGNIAQAHAADEWVSIEQLQNAYELYRQIADANNDS